MVVQRSATTTLSMYVDGTRVYHNTNYNGNTSESNDVLKIASGQGISTNWDGNNYSINGHMDEIRISNIARYTANFTPSTTPFQNDSNTLLLLHMDGTDGSTVFTDDNGVTPDHEY